MKITKTTLNVSRLLLTAMVGLVFLMPAQSYSQGDTTVEGLDILFVVDQSGSMGGEAFGANPFDVPEPNDPLNLRFEAVQFALDTLVDYKSTLAPNVNMRMAVINFGDAPVLTLDWTDIQNETTWGATRDNILQTLSVDNFGYINLGNTDFLEAFEAVEAAFDRLPNDGYQRAIIVLTDGQPCVPDKMACGVPDDQQAEMNNLIQFSNANFPTDQYAIYVMAIDENGDLWATRQADWQQVTVVADRATRVATNSEVSQRFSEILRELISTTSVTSNPNAIRLSCDADTEQTIDIPPFAQTIRISLFKNVAQPSQMVVRQPDGTIIDARFPTVNVSNATGAIEVWTIDSPVPGPWRFKPCSVADELSAELELILTQVQAQMPNVVFSQYENATFSFSVTDENGRPLPSYPAPYTLTINVSAVLPDGTVQALSATETGNREYEASIVLQQGGAYTIQLSIETILPDATPLIVYETDNLGTISTEAVQVTVTTLPSGEYKVGESAPVQVIVTDPNGDLMDIESIGLRAQLVGALTQEVALNQTGVGQYEGQFDFANAGNFTATVEVQYAPSETWQPLDSSTLTVIASEFIQLELVSPEDNLKLERSSGIPFFSETDNSFVIEVRVINATTQSPFDIFNFSQTPDEALTITIRDGKGSERAVVPEQNPAEAGVYRLRIDDLSATGEWTITASLQGDLDDIYIIDPTAAAATRTVTVSANPLQLPVTIGLGLLALLVVGGSGYFVRSRFQRRQHPCQGDFQIIHMEEHRGRQRENVLVDLNLAALKSNYIVIGRKHLRALPQSSKISKIVLTCTSDRMKDKKQVNMTIYAGRKTVTSNKMMSPSSTYRVPQEAAGKVDGYLEVRKDARRRGRGMF